MPRYLFHVPDLLGAIKDDEGMDLADLVEAKAEAVRSAREMVAEGKKMGAAGLDRFIEVKTAEAEKMFTLIFEEAALRGLDHRQRHSPSCAICRRAPLGQHPPAG